MAQLVTALGAGTETVAAVDDASESTESTQSVAHEHVVDQEKGTWPPGYWDVVGPPYALMLEEAPDHLVPASARPRLRFDLDRRHHRSALCHLEGRTGPPSGVAPTRPVHHDAWTAWVEHPGHGAQLPYLLDRESVVVVESTRPGEPCAAPLVWLRRWQLLAAGVLTYGRREDEVRREWNDTVERAQKEFRGNGFTNIASVIDPLHVGRLRRYYRTLVRTSGSNGVHLGDLQTPGRYVAYNEPVARFFQCQLARAVSQVVGRPVQPSFCYSASYVKGPGLPLHTDRLQCQYTLSVLVDMWPEPIVQTRWPFVLATVPEHTQVFQALGDGLLFLGRDIAHGRPAMRKRRFSTSLLFHYVDMDFDGPLG